MLYRKTQSCTVFRVGFAGTDSGGPRASMTTNPPAKSLLPIIRGRDARGTPPERMRNAYDNVVFISH